MRERGPIVSRGGGGRVVVVRAPAPRSRHHARRRSGPGPEVVLALRSHPRRRPHPGPRPGPGRARRSRPCWPCAPRPRACPAPRASGVLFVSFVAYALLTPDWARNWDNHPGNEPKYLRMAVALSHRLSLDVEPVSAAMEDLRAGAVRRGPGRPRPGASLRESGRMVAALVRGPAARGARGHHRHPDHAPDHRRQGRRRLPRARPGPFAAHGPDPAHRPRLEPRLRHPRTPRRLGPAHEPARAPCW